MVIEGGRNRFHWPLDVSFREDHCWARKAYAAQNLNPIRKLALALVSQRKTSNRFERGYFISTISKSSSKFDTVALDPPAGRLRSPSRFLEREKGEAHGQECNDYYFFIEGLSCLWEPLSG